MTFMRKRSGPVGLATGAALAAALLGWAPAFAQDAEAPAAEAPAAEAAPGTAAPSSVPQPDWTKVCGTVNEKEECHTERRRLAATGQPIAQFMIIEREGKRLVQIAVPPVALIQPGVQIKIDDGEPTGVKYVVCTPNECLALGEINDDFIERLKQGGTMLISMLNPQGKPVNFDLSLVGFTAIYDGPGITQAEAQANSQRLQEELERRAEAAKQQLLEAQQSGTQ
ncbi:MAG TPA: invasion associated locus B family protein [Phycisphaerae bacterium]|nr:invasion associated locus B family protein [Phycisphaerae bacterium]